MTKNSKAMRRVLCGVVSFLLSFFSCLFVMCLVFKFTVLSSSFLVGVEKRSDYAEALHSELKEQFVSHTAARVMLTRAFLTPCLKTSSLPTVSTRTQKP